MENTRTKNVTVLIARILLGLIYFVFGLNFFLHFIPTGPAPEGRAGAFMGGLFQAGYIFPFIKIVETVGGALLLAGIYIPLVLVILMPISLNILLFHSILEPGGAPLTISLLIIFSQIFLAWAYRDYYKQLFTAKAAI